jgi:hypothetical protein
MLSGNHNITFGGNESFWLVDNAQKGLEGRRKEAVGREWEPSSAIITTTIHGTFLVALVAKKRMDCTIYMDSKFKLA